MKMMILNLIMIGESFDTVSVLLSIILGLLVMIVVLLVFGQQIFIPKSDAEQNADASSKHSTTSFSKISTCAVDDDGHDSARSILRSASEKVEKMTGELLLEHAKNVPVLAPVAFLIGAIASR